MATLGDAVFRVGSGIGGWLVVFAWALVMAIMPQAVCEPGNDTVWGGTAIFGIVAALSGVLCGAGIGFKDYLKWMGAAAAPLIAWNVVWITPAVMATTLGEQSLCAISTLAPTAWERAWPLIQLGTAGIALFQLRKFWSSSPPEVERRR